MMIFLYVHSLKYQYLLNFEALDKGQHLKVKDQWHIDMRAWWDYQTIIFDKQIEILQDANMLVQL